MSEIEVGKHYKVSLPGESPWAECVMIHEDGTWEGRIDNDLVGSADEETRRKVMQSLWSNHPEPLPQMHDFKYNDVLRFHKEMVDRNNWVWSPIETTRGTA